jgi:hypothetical protein
VPSISIYLSWLHDRLQSIIARAPPPCVSGRMLHNNARNCCARPIIRSQRDHIANGDRSFGCEHLTTCRTHAHLTFHLMRTAANKQTARRRSPLLSGRNPLCYAWPGAAVCECESGATDDDDAPPGLFLSLALNSDMRTSLTQSLAQLSSFTFGIM